MENEKPKLKLKIRIDTGKLMKSISSRRTEAIDKALKQAAEKIREDIGLPSNDYGILESEIIQNPSNS